ncbi:hypothetical protein ABZY36_37740 [Streptomyces sp. NPDC006627]|uniref:hypothetical protein n=1 Tax=Streptomyces sp. NPDC006627 TaxID=3154679 RepID=UPI0033ACB39E
MRHDRQRWATAAVVCLGVFLLGLDLTVLNVAVPDLQRRSSGSSTPTPWYSADSY